MEHVKPLTKQLGATVHAILDETTAWCGYQYMSDKYHNGVRVPKAASTEEPLSCHRCSRKMKSAIETRMSHTHRPEEIEELLELSTKLIINRGNVSARK